MFDHFKGGGWGVRGGKRGATKAVDTTEGAASGCEQKQCPNRSPEAPDLQGGG